MMERRRAGRKEVDTRKAVEKRERRNIRGKGGKEERRKGGQKDRRKKKRGKEGRD